MGWSRFGTEVFSYSNSMFVDREEITGIFDEEYKRFKIDSNYFKVIGIYGIGGIGKSSLIEHLLCSISNSDSHIVTINMDIMHSAEIFDNLVKVRKQIDFKCLYFDYALLMLWDIYRIEKLNDDFMKNIKGNYLDILSALDSGLSYFVVTPGFENVLNLIRENLIPIITKFRLDKKVTDEIERRFKKNPELLYEFMPYLLGLDIKRMASKQKLVAFFDSYEQYLVDHDDWLKEMIGTSEVGLYIVASREPLNWENDEDQLLNYHLKELPRRAAESVLKSQLSASHYHIIDTILEKTQCVPIFVELAIGLYKNVKNHDSQDVVTEFKLINNKKDFVRRFMHHLPEDDQNIIWVLSVIRIFNSKIFEWIIRDLQIQCDVLKFHDLCKLCLVNFLKEDDQFLKLHDVFTSQAINHIEYNKRERIVQSYIKYIGTRGLMELSIKQLAILFKNLLAIAEKVSFTTIDIEYMLDIFFVLYENHGVPELRSWIDKSNAISLFPLRELVKLIYIEKRNALDSYTLSQHICIDVGRHILSYELIQNYACAVSGNYKESIIKDIELYNKLKAKDVPYWYYGKAIIYHGDHLMLRGQFLEALEVFTEYYQQIDMHPHKEGDSFEVRKQMGHCKRFNWLFEEADLLYHTLQEEYSHCNALKVLVLVNRCETNCYFNPEITISLAKDAEKMCEQYERPKDLAKVYYSLAIAKLHFKEYEEADKLIQKSIQLNDQSHYPSGKLFALMAKAYLEYAQLNYIQNDTIFHIKSITDKIGVYSFFELPLKIMQNKPVNEYCYQNMYGWIDYDYTVNNINKFLLQLKGI